MLRRLGCPDLGAKVFFLFFIVFFSFKFDHLQLDLYNFPYYIFFLILYFNILFISKRATYIICFGLMFGGLSRSQINILIFSWFLIL